MSVGTGGNNLDIQIVMREKTFLLGCCENGTVFRPSPAQMQFAVGTIGLQARMPVPKVRGKQ